MNRFHIPIRRVAGPAPDTVVVPASALAVRFEADAIVADAHRQAQALRERADEVVACANTEAEAIRMQAREDGLAQAEAQLDAARAALIDETLEWLVTEAQLEAEIAWRMEARIRALVADALEAFAGATDATELLMTRVQEALSQRSTDGIATLYVANEALAAAATACAQCAWVRVRPDPQLDGTQAVLETPLVRVHVDTGRHLQTILARLRDTPEKELADGRENHQ
jgi:hypothetical protein